jgi:hypothetical protein
MIEQMPNPVGVLRFIASEALIGSRKVIPLVKWDALLKFNWKHTLLIDQRGIFGDLGGDFMIVSSRIVAYIDSKCPRPGF